MILITGASGTIGTHLLELLGPSTESVRAMTRHPERLTAPEGVEVVHGDLDRPGTLPDALTDVRAVLLLTAPSPQIIAHDRALIDAAMAAGVEHVVKLSAIGTSDAEDSDDDGIGSLHHAGERALHDSELGWTILRPTSFASNSLAWASPIRSGAPIPNLTGTGTQGIIDPRDIAAVAAEVLSSGDHDQQVYVLTGPELLSVPDQAREIQEVLQRPVTTVDVSLDRARDEMLSQGVDPTFVRIAMAGSQVIRDGGNAILTDTVTEILGRSPRRFREWVRDHRAVFTNS